MVTLYSSCLSHMLDKGCLSQKGRHLPTKRGSKAKPRGERFSHGVCFGISHLKCLYRSLPAQQTLPSFSLSDFHSGTDSHTGGTGERQTLPMPTLNSHFQGNLPFALSGNKQPLCLGGGGVSCCCSAATYYQVGKSQPCFLTLLIVSCKNQQSHSEPVQLQQMVLGSSGTV